MGVDRAERGTDRVAAAALCGVAAGLLLGAARAEAQPPKADAQTAAATWLRDGIAKIRAGKAAEAKQTLARAADADPNNAAAHANLGIALWMLDGPEAAADALRRSAQIRGDDAGVQEFLGHVLDRAGRWDEARHACDRALEAGRTPRRLTALARADLRQNRLDAAEPLLREALELDPNYPPALYNLGVLHRLRGKGLATAGGSVEPVRARTERTAAVRCFERFAQVAKGDPHAGQAERHLAAIRTEEADAAVPTAEPPEKRPTASAVPKAQPEPAALPTPIVTPSARPAPAAAVGLVERAKKAVEGQDFDHALSLLDQAVSETPDNAEAHWQRAVLLDEHMDNRDRARGSYEEFVRRFPKDRRSPGGRQRIAALSGVAAAAAAASTTNERPVTVAVAERPPVPARPSRPAAAEKGKAFEGMNAKRAALQAWGEGLRLQSANDLDGAIRAYRRAVSLNGGLAQAHYNLGLACKAQGDLPSARDAFVQATGIDSSMVQAHYMLGVVYRDLKQPDQAIQSLARAIAEDPSYAKASYLLGVMLHEGGRPAEAGRHFRRYLELQPDGPSAPRARELLQSSTPFRR